MLQDEGITDEGRHGGGLATQSDYAHATPGFSSFGTVRIEKLIVADRTEVCSLNVLREDASGLQLCDVGGDQVHGPTSCAARQEKPLPIRKPFLKWTNSVDIQRVATGANGRSHNGMHLGWSDSKALLQLL
jgi:hypothetical protein